MQNAKLVLYEQYRLKIFSGIRYRMLKNSLGLAELSIRYRMEKRQEIVKLKKQDWTVLALKVLAESGIETVRVEPLAKLMNVTKGSFYWHFKNREELFDDMLQEWEIRETDNIIKQVEAAEGDANTKLLNLMEIVAQDDCQLERAMRIWAANDEKAQQSLVRIDKRRLDYLEDLFLELGFSTDEAKARARLNYYTWIGEFTLGFLPTSPTERIAEVRLYHAILVRRN
jgi:AcrR family transcriptional regulator